MARTPKSPDAPTATTPDTAAPAKAKAAKAKPVKAAKPALKVVEKPAPKAAVTTPAAAEILKLKELIDRVAGTTGGKKPEVKAAVEATLLALGEALAAGRSLALPPLGKLRVAKNKGPALTLKLRLGDSAKAAGLALADDGEDD